MDPLNMPEAMKNKQLDAIAGSEPWPLNVVKLCNQGVHELSDLYDPRNSHSHVVITTIKTLNEHKHQIQVILKALEKANEFLINNPLKSAEILSKHIGLSVEDQLVCTSRLKWQLGWEESDNESLAQTSKYFYQLNIIKEKPKIQEHIIKGLNF